MTENNMCAHLAANTSQALASLPDENGRETFLCGPCVAERIEANHYDSPKDVAKAA